MPNKKSETSITKIKDLSELKKVICFLEKNFPLAPELSLSLFNYLLEANKKIDFYGYQTVDEDSNLIGAILTPVQFFPENNKKAEIILNLSTWYMKKSVRGTKALIFAKEIIEDLSKYAITDYTASKSAEAIFKYLGFKYMYGIKRVETIFSCFTLRYFFYQKFLNVSFQEIIKKFPFLKNFSNLKGLSSYALEINGYKLYIIGLKKIKRFKKINLPIYQILWISNESIIKKFSNNICFLIIIKLNVFSVIYATQSEQISTTHKHRNIFKKEYNLKYLIKSSYKNFVPPIGSEISTKFI